MAMIFLSIPGLRPQDVSRMPNLQKLTAAGESRSLSASFPAVTWPVQANMLTGCLPREHGVVANGFFWRDSAEVEMWTAWNKVIERPQIWTRLHEPAAGEAPKTSAVWFPMLSKGSEADYICMPAPVHNPDGSESLWCYTKPPEFYGELLEQLGHFPLKNFWGPLASIDSSRWIARSAVIAAERHRPDLFFIYLPHLDYAAQRTGPDSEPALAAVGELDAELGKLADSMAAAYGEPPQWIVASEYVITEVDHVAYPNRLLSEAGLLRTQTADGRDRLDVAGSPAWALVDHQLSHVFVRDRDPGVIDKVVRLMSGQPGIDEVLAGDQRSKYALDHERSGDVILVSSPNSWQAYYWWTDDARAPEYARTVDIHRKPGYDPVELHVDMATRSIPLNAELVRGSHGAPVREAFQRGIVLASHSGLLPAGEPGSGALRDVDMYAAMRGGR
ncbi:alkaline phosphatase family protein [Candidatus Laterigemmans baculatus]|uniref:alkaline phosphatase family protein n=1 Tax=Candidatus Laterigemmans baculatus TaxID=2770505 RepID=UPI0013DA392D|nr:nucleotide pyrophosphatase/phosphodiesterase family protein [Candidatus Laterigemmans baculatus]